MAKSLSMLITAWEHFIKEFEPRGIDDTGVGTLPGSEGPPGIALNPILRSAFENYGGFWVYESLGTSVTNTQALEFFQREIMNGQPPAPDLQANHQVHPVHQRPLEGQLQRPLQDQGQGQGSWIKIW